MGRRSQKKELDITTKNAILDVALDIFAHEGLNGARMETIAKKANVSYGTVYYYYPSKEILFHVVALRARDASLSLLNTSLSSESSTYKALHNYFEAYYEWVGTPIGTASTLLMHDVLTSQNVPDETRIYMREVLQKTISMLTDIVEKIKEEGYAQNKDPHEMAVGILSLLTGIVFLKNAKLTNRFPVDTLNALLA